MFRQWPLSCKQFLFEHFAENRVSDVQLQNYGAINFVPFFSGLPCITACCILI